MINRYSGVAACVAMIGFLGCAAMQAAPERPECSDRALLALEASYVAEVMTACDGQHYDTCEARKAIEARYERAREEWISCK